MAPVTSLSSGKRRTLTKTAAVLLRPHLPPLYLNTRPCPHLRYSHRRGPNAPALTKSALKTRNEKPAAGHR